MLSWCVFDTMIKSCQQNESDGWSKILWGLSSDCNLRGFLFKLLLQVSGLFGFSAELAAGWGIILLQASAAGSDFAVLLCEIG